MEFKLYQKEIELQSRGWVPTFHDITTDVLNIVKESGIQNGTVTVASHHTTCCVMIQECSHDFDTFDLEYDDTTHNMAVNGAAGMACISGAKVILLRQTNLLEVRQ